MPTRTTTARSCSNIALIKYWGNINDELRLPANGSISMGLAGLITTTTVEFCAELARDEVYIGGEYVTGNASVRVSQHLDHVRELAGIKLYANVVSENNFPTGAGIASSASAFAALSVAAAAALGLTLSERELSVLARLGSGSAARSVPGGFVEWHAADRHEDSFAETFAQPDHWALCDLIAVVSRVHKATGSTEGHALANTSPYQAVRVATAPKRLAVCKQAILQRDFAALAEVVELDSTMMHSVMMTGTPPLFYWQPPTLAVMAEVREWRSAGLPVCYTIDAGANVHCLCPLEYADTVETRLRMIPDVTDVLRALPGGPAHVIED
ncbi:MAG: diphosphomevalonate decarboxylase [Aggregatilineales bacterium]